MTDWEDQGILLNVKPHGESSAILSILTKDRGRHPGYVKGALSKKDKGLYQPGNLVDVFWQGRLEEQLGFFRVEMITNYGVKYYDEPLKLMALNSVCALAHSCLSERFPFPQIYEGLKAFLLLMETEDFWPALYVHFEKSLLHALGFGLDLEKCTVCQCEDDLIYVSPKTARAVCARDGEPYKEKLLLLPPFLQKGGTYHDEDLMDGLRLTGYFLGEHIFTHLYNGEPFARSQFIQMCQTEKNPRL